MPRQVFYVDDKSYNLQMPADRSRVFTLDKHIAMQMTQNYFWET